MMGDQHDRGDHEGHNYIHAIDDTNFMRFDSLAVRALGAGLSWRDEDAIEDDIFQCAVMGRHERVRYLVEVKRVQVNQRDKWDSTPLYYACLAGHEPLVRYLLEQGARCEENTFDGERCFHAALTNDIRRMLREYKAVSRTHDPFSDFLRNSFYYHMDDLSERPDDERPPHSDVHFIVNGVHTWAHRVVLASRSAYFKQMFRTRWQGKRRVLLAHPKLDADAFKAVVHYLYNERLQVPRILLDETEAMVKQCKLWDLHGVLQREIKKQNVGLPLPERVVIELADIYRSTETQRTGPTPLQSAFGQVAMRSIRNAFNESGDCDDDDDDDDMFEDIVFKVEGKRFKCHKFFFCGRSEYFQALVMGNFREGEGNAAGDNTPGSDREDDADVSVDHESPATRVTRELELSDVSADAFAFIVDFMYTDNVTNALPFVQELRRRRATTTMTEKNEDEGNEEENESESEKEWHLVYEVLQLSDMYMLPVLRNLCSMLLSQYIDLGNLFDLADLAQLMGLDRLEEPIIQFMALNLEELVRQRKDTFSEMIRESAYSIANRQATDSIPIVDDIRSALDRMFPTDDLEAAQTYEEDDDWEDWEEDNPDGDDDRDAGDDGEEEEEVSMKSRVKARVRRNDRMVQEEEGDEGEDGERSAGKVPDERSNAAWTRYQYVVAAKNRKLELLDRLIEELGLSG